MRKINVYTKGYKEILKTKKYDFMEPAESFIRIYKTHIKNNKLLNSLDFGCGDGRHTKFLLKENHKVLATDISSAAIELTKKNIPHFNNTLLFNNEDFLNKFSQDLDLIVCWETIHWLGDYNKIVILLKNFRKMMKKNKDLIVTFPSEDHYLLKNKKIRKYSFMIKNEERRNMVICAPPLNQLKKMFFNCKFKISCIYKYSHGRKFYNKKKDKLKTISIKNMFSMYAFLLKSF
jgi:2-polyprenyl-3-methyl-5-hydroxy-6-metoxy-1,4-benzoquinol methylase|tara:strand:+ start:772 stop:1470 length:699 start_codon:yes stop_codon:yes gene_type:complete